MKSVLRKTSYQTHTTHNYNWDEMKISKWTLDRITKNVRQGINFFFVSFRFVTSMIKTTKEKCIRIYRIHALRYQHLYINEKIPTMMFFFCLKLKSTSTHRRLYSRHTLSFPLIYCWCELIFTREKNNENSIATNNIIDRIFS